MERGCECLKEEKKCMNSRLEKKKYTKQFGIVAAGLELCRGMLNFRIKAAWERKRFLTRSSVHTETIIVFIIVLP